MNYKNVNDYEVIYMIRENDDDALNIMYEKYRPLVKKIASKYFLLVEKKVTFDDLIQEGMIAVGNAIKTFNEYSDVLFYTYLSVCVERRLLTFCRNINSHKNYILNNSSFDENIDNRYDSNISCLDSIIKKEELINIKNKLSFLDSCVFELKFNGFTNNEITELLDISYKYLMYRIRKIRDIIKMNNNLFI